MLSIFYDAQEEDQSFNDNNVVAVLLDSFGSSQDVTKVSIMRFLSKIMCSYVLRVFGDAQMVSEVGAQMVSEVDHLDNIPKLMATLRLGLDGHAL